MYLDFKSQRNALYRYYGNVNFKENVEREIYVGT